MAEVIIQAAGLTRRFGDLTAVDGLALSVAPGEIYGLVGPDGAGKTTTLRMLAGIMDPDAGTAAIAGHDTRTASALVKDELAYMSQRFGLYTDLTVQENVEFYADLYGVPRAERGRRIDELLDFSYMRPFKQRLAGNLSGGMKQKLQLVCALVHTPKVLLLDEPTNGVDPVSRRDFWRILYELVRRGVAILVTTAYLDEAERCNRVGLLDHGKLLAEGTPDEVKGLLKGRILAIELDEARRASGILRDALPGHEVELFGDTVHITTPDPAATRDRASALLADNGLVHRGIHEQAPSLEDVFVSVLGDDDAGDTGQDATGEVIEVEAPAASPAAIDNGSTVSVRGLTRRFGSFTAANDVTFDVPAGQIFGFLGPNGAGKSTTIRMLCGLLKPSSGTGTVAGYDVNREPERIKQHIGYMSQKFSLYEDLTVEENITFYGGIYGLGGDRLHDRREWAVAMAGLQEYRHRPAALLSGGWRQRLALACAVLHEPPVVFLDEPTSGVDPLSRRRFWDLIYAMAGAGVTVFVTTHYMEEAEYCDRLALIYRANVIALGTPSELKRTAMRDRILNVACPRPQDSLAAIEALPSVSGAALFGAGLHVVTGDPAAAKAEILAECRQRGVAAPEVTEVLPGMEDVFVSLIEEADRNGADGGAR